MMLTVEGVNRQSKRSFVGNSPILYKTGSVGYRGVIIRKDTTSAGWGHDWFVFIPNQFDGYLE
jgi:hypothetical protein